MPDIRNVAVRHLLRGHDGEALLCDECMAVPDPPRPTGWLTYWHGRWRLAHGWCPWCASSPPMPDCPICDGTHEYGPLMDPIRRAVWRARWDARRGAAG